MSRMRKILIGILSFCMVIVFAAPSVFASYEADSEDGGSYSICDNGDDPYAGKIDGVKIEVYGDNDKTPISKDYTKEGDIDIDTSNRAGVVSSATAQGGSATSKAIINGDVKVNANANEDYNVNVDGVIANANISPSGNATAIVEVNGSVNVGSSEYEGNTIGIETVAFGRESTRGGSNRGTTSTTSSSVEVQNDVNVSSVSSATGVDMQAVYDSPNNKETAVNVSVGGDVNVSAGNEAYGISFFSEKSNEGNIKAEIAVGGDVNAKITGSTETEIASSLAAGIYIQKFNDADKEPYGPIQNLNMTADINGSIIADGGENGTSIGVLLAVDNSTVNLSAKNISAISTGELGLGSGAEIYADGGSEVVIHVEDDLSGATNGLYLDSKNGNDSIEVVVGGTLSGGENSVVIGDIQSVDSLKLTVWKAELYKDDEGKDHVISGDLASKDLQQLEQNIQYIIKVEQPTTGGSLKALNADGGALLRNQTYGFDTAIENEMVLLEITPDDGYEFTGAFNGLNERIPIAINPEDGKYYVSVPRGGGVYLTATFSQIPKPEPEEEKQEEKKEEEKQPEKTQPKQQEQEAKAEVPAAKPEESARSAQLIALAPQAVVPARQADVLLTKEDNDKKIKITFYDNSTYSVLLEDGITSSGRFMIKNGEIVLSVPSGDPASIDKDGHLEYIPFSHVSGTDSLESMGIHSIGNSYDFDFSSDELTTLLSGIKASPSLTVQDNSGKLNVTFYSNGIYEAAYQDAEDHTSLYYGTFRLEKQEDTGKEVIVLRDVNGQDMPVQEDGTLKMTLDQSEFSCQLTNENIESLKTIAAQN